MFENDVVTSQCSGRRLLHTGFCGSWQRALAAWPAGQGAEAAGSAAAWPAPASGRSSPLPLCPTFPVRASGESGHRWPPSVLRMDREVSALCSWGQLPGGLRYHVIAVSKRNLPRGPPLKPLQVKRIMFQLLAGAPGSRMASSFQPGPHSTLTAGQRFKQRCILPGLSRVTRAESLPLPGPRPSLGPPHLGKPLWIIVSKLLV